MRKNLIQRYLDLFKTPKELSSNPKLPPKGTKLPSSRVSMPSIQQSFTGLKSNLAFVTADFNYEYIPVIRKLFKVNSSVFRAATTLADIINPGFTLKFDSGVSPDEFRKINAHLFQVYKRWGLGTAGIHGLINKMIYQIYIGGAISTEWVPLNNLSGINYLAFINPEEVRVGYNPSIQRYDFFQIPKLWMVNGQKVGKDFIERGAIKLNPVTYTYLGLFTDEEIPIGTPPFLSAIDDINSQLKMLKNIGFVTDQLGIMGFLEALLEKPSQRDGETPDQYLARLNTLLDSAKTSIKDGVKDGVIAGFKDEHEFNFHASTKDTTGVADIFGINQRMVSNGLLIPSQFLGGNTTGAETMVNIVFTLMLSQLHTIQQYVARNLEKGLWLELSMAGFKFNTLEIIFNKSTITDSVKEAQAEEIKIRNSRTLYGDGQISQEGYASRHGIDAPDQPEPRIPIDPNAQQADILKKEKINKGDNTSDQKTREKRKNQPKRKTK